MNPNLKKRTKGIILLTVGIYLSIINPIFSLLFNQVYVSHGITLDPINYWMNWFFLYGSWTLIFVIIGAYMIKIGSIYVKLEKFSD